MSSLHAETLLLDVAQGLAGFAVNWLLQSTMLIAAGILMARLLRHRGSAVQSAVYRTTLVAVLVCPLVSGLLSFGDVSGWSIEMPAAWAFEQRSETLLAQYQPDVTRLVHRSSQLSSPRDVTEESTLSAAASIPGEHPAISANSEMLPMDPAGPAFASATSAASSDRIAHQSSSEPTSGKKASIMKVYLFGVLAAGTCSLWLMITSVLLARLSLAWWRLAHLRRTAVTAEEPTVHTCRELASQMYVAAPEVLRSPFFPSPCLTGLHRPAILLPDVDLNLSVRDVLVHELAHLRRRDCHWNLLSRMATAMFFFQPLLWQLTRRLEATAEEVCDDYVVQLGGDRQEYAHRLVDIAELSSVSLATAGVGIVSLRTMLAVRVSRIMDTSRSLSTRVGNLLLVLVLASGLIGTLAAGFVGAGSSSDEPSPSPAPAGLDAADDRPKIGQSSDGKEAQAVEIETERTSNNKASPASTARADITQSRELRGRVLGADGKAVAGATLHWFRSRVHDLNPMKPKLLATTNAAGEFRFNSPAQSMVDPNEPAGWMYGEHVVVTAPGYGFTTTTLRAIARAESQPRGGIDSIIKAFASHLLPTVIELPSSGEPIRGQLVNIDGQPIAGASVRILWFNEIVSGRSLQRDKNAPDKQVALREQVKNLLNVIEPEQLRQVLPMATTDSTGRFELHGIGPNRLLELLIQGERIESIHLVVRNQPGENVTLEPDPHSNVTTRTLFSREFLHAVGPSKPVVGRVVDFDTGKPLADAIVRVYAVHGIQMHSSRELQEFATRTDSDGRYRISGLPIGPGNHLVAFTTGDVAYLPAGYPVDTSRGESVERDFRLKHGTWAEGRVFDAATNKPFVGEISYYHFRDRELEKQVTGLFRAFVDGRYLTNSKGEFRVPVLPIRGILAFNYSGHDRESDGIDRFPRGAGADTIDGSEDMGGLRSFPTLPHYLIPSNYERLAGVHPVDGQKTIRVDMPLYSSQPVKIRVLDADGKPVSGYAVYGANDRWGWQVKVGTEFQVEDLLPKERRKVFVFHRDRDLAGGVLIHSESKQPVEVRLTKSGSISGRLVDADGEPISDAKLQGDYEKLENDETTAIWADAPGVIENPQVIRVDKQGRFVVDGLIPGWIYNAHVSARRKLNGEMMDQIIGSPFQGVTVAPGEKKDLGDLVIDESKSDEEDQTNAKELQTKDAQSKSALSSEIKGTVLDADGKPVTGAHVAVVGMANEPMRGGDLGPRGEVLSESITSDNGKYRLTLHGISSKTHRYANLIVRRDGSAVSWKTVNLDEPKKEMDVQLSPDEPIRARLVNIEGQSAEKVKVQVRGLVKRSSNKLSEDGVGYDGKRIPGAWLPSVVSDAQGRFIIHGVPPGYGVYLDIEGGERFAPQNISLNTGGSEKRGEHDGTYRPLVKNADQGEEAILSLAPAQLFEGTVRCEDTGKPVPHAKLTIWASQQAEWGSMVLVAGAADGQGNYRISPRPGIRFGVTAYPPDGQPYLIRQTTKPISWEAGDRIKRVDMTLPRGIVVRGRVIDAATGAGVADAAIQYLPEGANNPRASDEILTGWQGIQLSDKNGNFQIVVLDGPGWLIAHSSRGNFIFQEVGSSQLSHGKGGGQRNYAHVFLKVNPKANTEPLDVKLELQPGAKIAGKILDAQGKAVDETLVITRLVTSHHTLWWRGHTVPVLGGRFELSGLREGLEYPTYFLDAKRQLGATAVLKASEASPTVVLQPCGSATMKFVNSKGEAVADHVPTVEMVVTPGCYRFDMKSMNAGELAADSDFIANIDRVNHWRPRKSDAMGKITLPGLIPGATYRVMVPRQGRNYISKEFQPKSGETVDLGELTVERM